MADRSEPVTGATDKQIKDAVDRKLGYSVTWPEEAKEAYRRQEYELVKHEARYLVPPGSVIALAEHVVDAADREAIGRALEYIAAWEHWAYQDPEVDHPPIAADWARFSEARKAITPEHLARLERLGSGGEETT